MHQFLREGESSSSAGMRGVLTKHLEDASLPARNVLLSRASTSSSEGLDTSLPGPIISESSDQPTSMPLDRHLPSNTTTDNLTGGSNHTTTQSPEPWRTQLQRLYALLDNFQSDFNCKLEELRAGIPFPLRNSSETDYQTPKQSIKFLARHGRAIQQSSETALLRLRSDLAPTTAVAVVVNSPYTSTWNSGSDGGD